MPRPRGIPDRDPTLQGLLDKAGRLASDPSSEERHYARSRRIRKQIQEYLTENEGSFWVDVTELEDRAANYASCSTVTARRWVRQFTRAGQRWKLTEGVEGWTLDRRNEP